MKKSEKRTLMQILQVDVLKMPKEDRLQFVDERQVSGEAPWLQALGKSGSHRSQAHLGKGLALGLA